MKLKTWFQQRGIVFILNRVKNLNERYGLSPRKAAMRILHTLQVLISNGCLPTFFVPAITVKRNAAFIRSLQEQGCEIGVHGYNHVDLKSYPPEDASQQLLRAADLLGSYGLEVRGFRCPYLSVTNELIQTLPRGIFHYSSNRAIEWPIMQADAQQNQLVFEKIQGFYLPSKAQTSLSLPWEEDGLFELPVCVPDDLQMRDGLGFDQDQLTAAWLTLLENTHRRGELLNLMFHPELSSFCEAPFVTLLEKARSLRPAVWVTMLREVSEWWQERSRFSVEIRSENGGRTLTFQCSDRATLLCRGFEPISPSEPWDETYHRLPAQDIFMEGRTLPFIGVSASVPAWVEPSLKQMGYIIVEGENAQDCSICLESERLEGISDPVTLIESIEREAVPLVRYWPWPDGARSALCISGDLDAVSLMDYAARLVER